MKKHNILWIIFLSATLLVFASAPLLAQEDKPEARMVLSFHQDNNGLPYVDVLIRTRINKRFEPISGVGVNLFFNEESEGMLMGKVVSDENGSGKVPLPEKFRAQWDSLAEVTFMAVFPGNDKYGEATEELTIKKAKMSFDIKEEDSVKTISITVSAQEEGEWTPVEGVEMKVGVKRLFGELPLGEEESYTTDADGKVDIEFNQVFPGDEKGNITLRARTEDHEEFGNVSIEKVVAWGKPLKTDLGWFDERTLWATRDKTPIWLLVFPNMIIIGVWGVIFFLAYQLYKVRKMGKINA